MRTRSSSISVCQWCCRSMTTEHPIRRVRAFLGRLRNKERGHAATPMCTQSVDIGCYGRILLCLVCSWMGNWVCKMLRLDIPLAGEIMLATLPFADAKRWGRAGDAISEDVGFWHVWWQSNIWTIWIYINARLWTGCYSHVITSWAPGEASILNPIWCTRMCAAAVKYFEQSNACSNLMRLKTSNEENTWNTHIHVTYNGTEWILDVQKALCHGRLEAGRVQKTTRVSCVLCCADCALGN